MADQEVVPDDDAEHAKEREQVEDTGNLSSPEDGPQPGDPDATVVVYATEDELEQLKALGIADG